MAFVDLRGGQDATRPSNDPFPRPGGEDRRLRGNSLLEVFRSHVRRDRPSFPQDVKLEAIEASE